MTTLAADAPAGSSRIQIDEPLSANQIPGWVKIDNEILHVGDQHYRPTRPGGQIHPDEVFLILAQATTTSHSSGATVTYSGRPFDPTFTTTVGGAGGEQTIRLLGPYRVDFDTPGFVNPADNGVATLEIPAGVLVVKVVPLVVTYPVGVAPGDALYLNLLTASNGSGPVLGAWDLFESDNPDAAVGLSEMRSYGADDPDVGFAVPSSRYLPKSAFAVAECSIYANIGSGEAFTAGAWDIYALIAEPAA